MDLKQLQDLFPGRVFSDPDVRSSAGVDFGRIVSRTPAAVVLAHETEDVQQLVEYGIRHHVPLVACGSSHSQGGQSLIQGGLSLDTSALATIGSIAEESVWVGAGASWKEVVAHTLTSGMLPAVLPSYLGLTVGGTLSVGGVGASSHRCGLQVDNVLQLEVVTGNAERVLCSPTQNRDLFDASLCGLGQFSIICKARLRLRPAAPTVETIHLLYDDLAQWMVDQETILEENRFHYLDAWCSPCMQGLRRLGELRMPFAHWFYPVEVSVEGDSSASEMSLLQGLRPYKILHRERMSIQQFVNRQEPLFQEWREKGYWKQSHPWMEVLLPWKEAGSYVEAILSNLPPDLVTGGRALLWTLGGKGSVPMFRRPEGDPVLGFGILCGVPSSALPRTLPVLQKASDLALALGGKRYLSSWVDLSDTQWVDHFGSQWMTMCGWKTFFDPHGVLNPGYLPFHSSDPAG